MYYMVTKLSQVLDVRQLIPHKNGPKEKYFTYRITLPPEWVKKHGLQKGGRLLVKETDEGHLILEKV